MDDTQQAKGPEPSHAETRGEVAAVLEQLAILAVRHLATRDISFTAASTLARLDRGGPARLTSLAGDEGISQPSMTQLVQRLERQSLVERVSDPGDGRVVLVTITDAGRQLLADRRRARTARLAELLATLPPEDEQALAAVARTALPTLHRLLGSLTQAEKPPAYPPA
jgi:DNA-binding MarR family transcriptional regulator